MAAFTLETIAEINELILKNANTEDKTTTDDANTEQQKK
jgi:hypothetical protein